MEDRIKGMQEMVLDALLQVLREKEQAAIGEAARHKAIAEQERTLHHAEKQALINQHTAEKAETQKLLDSRERDIQYWQTELQRTAVVAQRRANAYGPIKELEDAARAILIVDAPLRVKRERRKQLISAVIHANNAILQLR